MSYPGEDPEITRLATAQLLDFTSEAASRYLATVHEGPTRARVGLEELRSALGGPFPDSGSDPLLVVRELIERVEPGLVSTAGPRYFGFVIGGSLPAALAADWLAASWDQNAGLYVTSPAAAVIEEVVAGWLLELLGLPPSAAVGFVTGCQMANFSCLAAARHAVLRRAGWNVEEKGLRDAPPVRVVAGREAHTTISVALRFLGLGTESVVSVAADDQGRMLPAALEAELQRASGPTIVCAQAGNVNTGAFDPLPAICDAAHRHAAWVHVDGAFGLWAAASAEMSHLAPGLELADSWATDAHKWLNVPYDNGIAIVADPGAMRGALSADASYLVKAEGSERDPLDFTPEFSRRARGFAVYAALKSLGRQGVSRLIESACTRARQFAARLSEDPDVEILNQVVLNQVLVRFRHGDDPEAGDARTRAVIRAVQDEGTCWLGGAVWLGRQVMRISVSNWSTRREDVERSCDAILGALHGERARAEESSS